MKVRIFREPDMLDVSMIFYEDQYGKRQIIDPITGEGIESPRGVPIPKEFIVRIPGVIAQDVLKALTEALDEEGIKTEKDAKIQGTLDATRYHLEDLRKLLKLK